MAHAELGELHLADIVGAILGLMVFRNFLGVLIGTFVGQQIAAALAGQTTVDAALQASQAYATTEMTRSGYIK